MDQNTFQESTLPIGRTITVALIDDHEVVRQGLQTMLQKERDIKIAGQASDPIGGFELIKDLRPDVVLLDIQLGESDMDGFSLMQKIRSEYPFTGILLLTGYDSELYLTEAIKSKADGFILKECPRMVLASAIRMVCAGLCIWDTRIFYRAMGNISRQLTEPTINSRYVNEKFGAALTDKERLVFHLLAKGYCNKDIGNQLKYTSATVKKYVYRCMKKLGVSNRTQLAVLAHNYGIK
ncbi:response regulator transcription factor [Dehalogenimonas sp. 4OHTPN]|uniref:Response regulator transcription factor n=1 Tax=Dehalogenimonas sp. 4OHTPN TaxID=3166643 RepID=A0AAU8GBL6_9CHLR